MLNPKKNRWVLVLPVVAFAIAAWVFVQTDRTSQVQFDRAKSDWREGKFPSAIEGFQALYEKEPNGALAPQALWEIATIYYYNLYDISNALHYFERLSSSFPESQLAIECELKAAEIYEVELNEISKALEHWQRVQEAEGLDPALRQEIQFKIADAHFKAGAFDEAYSEFEGIIHNATDPHLVQQAHLRQGNTLQIRKEHERAIADFDMVLAETSCENCRLRAQLGLIESYEYLDRLSEAIKTAESISVGSYPDEMKRELLTRLLEKRKYYEPRRW